MSGRRVTPTMWLVSATLVSGFSLLVSRSDSADESVPAEPAITASDRAHWAFQPIRKVEIPAVKDGGWCRNDIDRFILAKLETKELHPLPEANRTTLIRRVTFDLTGLPPTPEEVDRFVADLSPDAHEKLLDRLLASSAYGERWAQHWLDLARFAETDGFEHDLERPNAWRYRDWVIEALNRDMPYDEFVRLQLAGDELHPEDSEAIIATGFLLCGPDMPDINLQEERRHTFLNDLTGTIGSTLLGLQLGCAACHDHKFDPISQFDFYRMRAFFDPMEIFKDHPLPMRESEKEVDPKQKELAARVTKLAGDIEAVEETVRKRLRAENPDLQPTAEDLTKAMSDEEKKQRLALSKELEQLRKEVKTASVPLGRVIRETSKPASASRFMTRGDFRRPGPEVPPDFPRVANVSLLKIEDVKPQAKTSERRTQLARWIVDPANPLAARVMANRLWQFHFGRGLVETASDFGKMGSDPTHPELLDWLATEFVRQEWSLKRMHKLILMSATYRQASRPTEPGWTAEQSAAVREAWKKARELDPDNRLLSRFPRLRLEGEAIRDAMLVAAERLSSRKGGLGVRPPLPQELLTTILKNQWNVSPDEEDHRRRSVYLFVRRNLRYPLFEAFDRPDTNASCPRRNRSTIAPQALILFNSEFSLAAARDLAGFLYRETRTDDERVTLAFRRTLGRAPTESERRKATEFLTADIARLKDTQRPAEELALPTGLPKDVDVVAAAAMTDLCLALFNLNEFVYLD